MYAEDSVPDPAIDVEFESLLEGHFRLGMAVHRAECLFVELLETIQTIDAGGTPDLVDTAFRGETTAEARLSALVVVAFQLTDTAITLWERGSFQDVAVAAQLCQRRQCQERVQGRGECRASEMFASGAFVEGTQHFDLQLQTACNLISAMRAYLWRFGQRHFPTRFEEFCPNLSPR